MPHPAKSRTTHFGLAELICATGPMANLSLFRFSTKYQDDETDLIYYGYRYYNASTGRWLSGDPIEERGGINLYGFVYNCSISKIDRLGLFDIVACTEALKSIYEQSAKLLKELRKYDPVADGQGGFVSHVGTMTVPGGHYQKIADLQRGLKNRLTSFVSDCIDKKGGGGGKPFPGWADQLANIRVPEPIYDPTTPIRVVQFKIPEMPAIEEVTTQYIAYGEAVRNAEIAQAVGKGALAAGGCYVVYRGIRMLPSLIPPLWWTIPANAIAP